MQQSKEIHICDFNYITWSWFSLNVIPNYEIIASTSNTDEILNIKRPNHLIIKAIKWWKLASFSLSVFKSYKINHTLDWNPFIIMNLYKKVHSSCSTRLQCGN